MSKLDRSKIQNPNDYAMNNPSFTSPSMNDIPTQNKFTVIESFPPLPSKLTTFAQAPSSSSKNHSKEYSSTKS
jgi:hypothetical protein